ncbi:putative 30S ribosomal protein S3 [Citreicella sp. SE45]|nr:putative 30S ribosomal protein S3 [Citreicella sp. SE45]
MDDDIERLRRILLAMSEVDVEAAEYRKLRAQLISELVRIRAEQDLLERLRPVQDQVDRMGARDPDFDLKSFMDAGWE